MEGCSARGGVREGAGRMTRRNVAGIASGETLYPAPKQLILHPDKRCDQLCVEDAAWRRRTRLRYPEPKWGKGGLQSLGNFTAE